MKSYGSHRGVSGEIIRRLVNNDDPMDQFRCADRSAASSHNDHLYSTLSISHSWNSKLLPVEGSGCSGRWGYRISFRGTEKTSVIVSLSLLDSVIVELKFA